MDEPAKAFAPDLSSAQSKQWIGRLLIAVVLGIAIWNFVVSLTTAVILPGLSRIMETDPQSPLYLGKGDFNIPGIFAAVLELCLALIAVLLVNSWAQRRPRRVARKSVVPAAATTSIISPPPAPPARAPLAEVPMPAPVAQPAPAVAVSPSPPSVAKPPAAQIAAPAPAPAEKPKPKKPKQVYYNSVGEPIELDE